MSYFLNNLGFAILTVILSSFILTLVVNPPPIEQSSTFIDLPDTNRHLSYFVRGDATKQNCIIWLHGLISSRYEILGLDEGVLVDLDAFVVAFDRPGYGESELQPRRGFADAVSDVLAVADGLNVSKFFVAGVSAGGAYGWAAASLVPDRIRGLLLFSPAGPHNVLESEAAEREAKRLEGTRHGALRRYVLAQPAAAATLKWLAETYVGGRALYSLWLEDAGRQIISRMQDVDARCISRQKRSEYTLKILPESLKQGVATGAIQDVLLVLRPWPFKLSAIPPSLAGATHVWHGSNDALIPVDYAHAFKRLVPAASLEVVEGGGHHAYWVCSPERQREALSRLVKRGLPA